MKNYWMITLLLPLVMGCAKQPATDEKADVETAVKEFYVAIQNQDYDKIKSYCTPDFNGYEDGTTYNKLDDFLSALKSMEITSAQINMESLTTNAGKELAHCVAHAVFHFTNQNGPATIQLYEDYLLKKIDGKWLFSYVHSSHPNNNIQLQKGSLLGVHTLSDIELKKGVTMDQVRDFMDHKMAPGINEANVDFKMIPLKGLRGDSKDSYGYIMFFNSDQVRNALMAGEGKLTPKGEEMIKKVQPLLDERDKLFTYKKDRYTDWEVQ